MKIRTSIIICLALLFTFPLLAACEATAKKITTNAPQRVAVASEWPESNPQYSYEVLLEEFLIKFPEKPKRISVIENSLIIFNENGSVIHLSPITAADLASTEFPNGITANSNISVSMAGQIPFEKTVNDPVPQNPEDMAVWQDAMKSKKEIFGDSNLVLKSEKNGLKAYFYESPLPPLGNYASIHDLNRPNFYLHIAGQNLSFEEFKKLIWSIELRK